MILARRVLKSRGLAVCLPTFPRLERILGRAAAGPALRPFRLPDSALADSSAGAASRGVSASGTECDRMSCSPGLPSGGQDRKGIW